LISAFSVRRRVTILMGVLAVLLLGGVSAGRISVDLFPRFDFPAAGVVTEYPGAAPAEVESHVTRVVEEAVGRVARVKTISSISLEERSVVIVQFEWNTDMDYATLEMREKLDLASRYFPDEAGRPVVTAFDPSSLPLLFVAVSGGGRSDFAPGGDPLAGDPLTGDPLAGDPLVALRRLAMDAVKPRLERVDGVAAVTIIGGAEEEVLVAVDPDRLAAAGLTWLELRTALAGASLNLPGGSVTEDGQTLLIRSLGEFEDLDDLEALVVGVRTETRPTPLGPRTVAIPVRLGEVADVALLPREVRDISRLGGEDSVILSVQKASDANSVDVARRVKAELDLLRQDLPPGLRVEVTVSQADFIARAVGLVGANAWQGALLAALVLLLFLRNLRSVLIIGLAMPISVVATFTLMYFSNLTLNLMTVGGLALGVGMLVDNSIVVLENIFRHLEEGKAPVEAAVDGSREVSTAISASTLTTVVVFLPVVFVGGVAGTLFKELAVTVSFSLLSSLAVALTFVPMAAATLFTAGRAPGRRVTPLPSGSGEDRSAPALRGRYRTLVRGALRSRYLVLGLAAAAVLLAVRLVPGLGAEFVPPMDRGEVIINVRLPAGSDLASTDALVRRVEEVALGVPEARFVTSTVGSSGGLMLDAAGVLGGGTNVGSVTLKLVERDRRERSADEIVRDLERRLFNVRGGRITVESLSSFMSMGGIRPVELVIRGYDPEVLAGLAEEVASIVRQTPGTVNVDSGRAEPRPELVVRYDRDRLAALGLHPAAVAVTVREAIEGRTVGTLSLDGRRHDVVLRYDADSRKGIRAVEDFVLRTPGGYPVSLTEVAEVTRAEGPSAISRQEGRRVVVVSAGVTGRDLASVTADIVARLDRLEFPEGYDYTVAGEHEQMEEAFAGLGLALSLAVVLVYMVMASQFESLVQPLVIMVTIPLAVVGVVAALRLTGITLSVPSVIGIIMLGGIVVNNAIVLLDFVGQIRARGVPRDEAVLVAAGARLRPILMTTATTALGLLPMAAASLEGSELANSLAVAVIGGLVSSTLLTLVVIPATYVVADDLVTGVRAFFGPTLRRSRGPAGPARAMAGKASASRNQ
jgi:HAE1 family hydrophobic/amphiphilic exporter-1